MNYYAPREIADKDGNPTGKWRYTVRNDDRIWAVGYCNQQMCEHDTPEEAREHYRQYELDHHIREIENAAHADHCAVCAAWTTKGYEVGLGVGPRFMLCDEHRNTDYVREHYAPGDAISSW